MVGFAEEQGYAPDCRKTYYGVDNAREKRALTAANPRDDIKLENTDAAPVKSADNG